MKTDGIRIIIIPGQVLTTPKCFKSCLLEMQGVEHAMWSVNSCSFQDTGSLSKEADFKLLLSSFIPYPCDTWSWFVGGVFFSPLPAFIFTNEIYYWFPVYKHWIEITRIFQLSVYIHGSIPFIGCSENSPPVSCGAQLNNWAQSPFDQSLTSLEWKVQRNSEWDCITIW